MQPKSLRRPSLLMPLLLALSAMLQSCSSTPTYVAAPCPQVPALPKEARQQTTGCSPNCSKQVGSEISISRQRLTNAGSPAAPASESTTR